MGKVGLQFDKERFLPDLLESAPNGLLSDDRMGARPLWWTMTLTEPMVIWFPARGRLHDVSARDVRYGGGYLTFRETKSDPAD